MNCQAEVSKFKSAVAGVEKVGRGASIAANTHLTSFCYGRTSLPGSRWTYKSSAESAEAIKLLLLPQLSSSRRAKGRELLAQCLHLFQLRKLVRCLEQSGLGTLLNGGVTSVGDDDELGFGEGDVQVISRFHWEGRRVGTAAKRGKGRGEGQDVSSARTGGPRLDSLGQTTS